MALFNPIQYTSRTFEAILQDINSDTELVDKPDWWKRGLAGIGDVISMWNNAAANNLLLDTAFTRRNVQLLLELIDYQLSPQSTSSGTLLFQLDSSVVFPVTIAKNDLAALTSGTTTVSSKRFEARAGATVTQVDESFLNTAVNTGTDIITVARQFLTGEKVRITTTGGLPAPLATGTDYYVIAVSSTEIKLATSQKNAFSGTNINLTTQGTGTHTATLYSTQVTCYQQTSKNAVSIGESDGVTEWQEFDLPDIDILKDTLIITINSIAWTLVDTWVDSISTDTHYRLFYNNDNSAVILFGNGTYGQIPPAFEIEAEYATGGNSDSNITTANKITLYAGADSNITGVTNPGSMTGGDDPEAIEEAKIIGPLLLKARDRFVTGEDGKALALGFNGISQSKVLNNYYGVLSARVLNIANGGGNLSAGEKTELQDYLIDRTILESIDVRVEDTTITAQNTTSSGKVLSGFTWAGGVEEHFRLGWKLFWTEAGQEILLDYNSNGVDSARALINTILSESYTSSDNSQIQAFLDAWNNQNVAPREIGEDSIQSSDAFAFIASNTVGLDYMTISVPAFPVAIAADEITTPGTLTLTEIP